jgi:hypothetical protein
MCPLLSTAAAGGGGFGAVDDGVVTRELIQ